MNNLPGFAAAAFGVWYSRAYARNDGWRDGVDKSIVQNRQDIAVQAALNAQVVKRLDEIFQLQQALNQRIDSVFLGKRT